MVYFFLQKQVPVLLALPVLAVGPKNVMETYFSRVGRVVELSMVQKV
jgi:uncharacterized protein YlxW (UPF0749 family)